MVTQGRWRLLGSRGITRVHVLRGQVSQEAMELFRQAACFRQVYKRIAEHLRRLQIMCLVEYVCSQGLFHSLLAKGYGCAVPFRNEVCFSAIEIGFCLLPPGLDFGTHKKWLEQRLNKDCDFGFLV